MLVSQSACLHMDNIHSGEACVEEHHMGFAAKAVGQMHAHDPNRSSI